MRQIIVILLYFLCLSAYAQTQQDSLYIIKALKKIKNPHISVQVALYKNDQILLVNKGKNVDNNSVFNIGSTTKTYTAYLVLQAVNEGKLTLNDTIGKFFSGNPNVPENITIKELLYHISGLGDVLDGKFNSAFLDSSFCRNNQNLYDSIPVFNEEQRGLFQYNNTNYLLLGYILEKIYHASFCELFDSKIKKKFGLHNTYCFYDRSILNIAHPYIKKQGDLFPYFTNNYYSVFCFSAGGLAANAKDVAAFLSQLFAENPYTTIIQNDTSSQNYYAGFEKMKTTAGTFWGHGGDNIGYTSKNYYNARNKQLLVFLINTRDSELTNKLGRTLIKLIE